MEATTSVSRALFSIDLHPAGHTSLPTFLFIHGAGGSHRTWRRQHELSKEFRLILLDLPGHGESGGEGEATITGYAAYVADYIASNRLRNVVLCGHSMGGAIALHLALNEPKLLNGLVLVGTGARLRVLPAIFALIREDFSLAVQGMAGFLFYQSAPPALVEEERELLSHNSPELLLKDFTACDSFDIMERVDEIRLPSLVVCGKDDRLTGSTYSELLHQKISGSRFVLFEQCGHMPMLEQSEAFNEILSSFAKELQE
jgi:pimeloyl-ACP methyl ester carboxylesterase